MEQRPNDYIEKVLIFIFERKRSNIIKVFIFLNILQSEVDDCIGLSTSDYFLITSIILNSLIMPLEKKTITKIPIRFRRRIYQRNSIGG